MKVTVACAASTSIVHRILLVNITQIESLMLEQSTKIKDGPLEFPPFFLVGMAVTRMVLIAKYCLLNLCKPSF